MQYREGYNSRVENVQYGGEHHQYEKGTPLLQTRVCSTEEGCSRVEGVQYGGEHHQYGEAHHQYEKGTP